MMFFEISLEFQICQFLDTSENSDGVVASAVENDDIVPNVNRLLATVVVVIDVAPKISGVTVVICTNGEPNLNEWA